MFEGIGKIGDYVQRKELKVEAKYRLKTGQDMKKQIQKQVADDIWRQMTTKVSKKTDEARMSWRGADFYEKMRVRVLHGTRAEAIDTAAHTVALSSGETLSYDATMADWRVHTGWDIAAPLGEPVLAAANGRVASVTVSEDLGTVVEVGHSNGLTSVYANLEDACPVSAGQIVRVGSVLGAVGTSARAESAEESHLHFALRRNGEVVDPADWLPQP